MHRKGSDSLTRRFYDIIRNMSRADSAGKGKEFDAFLKQFTASKLRPRERDAVESAARSADRRGETVNRADTAALIRNYLQRFTALLDHRQNPESQQRALERLKHLLHEQCIIKAEDIPPSYYASIERRHREEGHGDIDIPATLKAELGQTLIADQTRSLDAWIDYLASDDSKYPDALKYWSFRSVLKMGKFDKEKKKFGNREGRGTVSPFPPLNREAFAIVLEDMERKIGVRADFAFTSRFDIGNAEKQAYKTAIDKDDFASLYALAIDAFKPISDELLTITGGQWRTYPRGSDPKQLVASIADYGTGWCLRGEATARRYLQGDKGAGGHDLHVYYSNDPEGKPVVPRVVMVVNPQNQIMEVRGIEQQENIDSYIGDIVDAKLASHPDGSKFLKKSADMKRLTSIERKTEAKEPLTKDDLLFLYEIETTIEGFGYQRDPRIAELRSQRNAEEDMLTVFACTADQIARRPEDINEETKAYVGPLSSGLFACLPHDLQHIYTSFPEGRIRQEFLTIGDKSAEELEKALDATDARGQRLFQVNDYARSMMHNKKQFIAPVNERYKRLKGKAETMGFVRLTVADLGFKSGATTKEIFDRAREIGLELCPPETGPHYRLAHPEQPLHDWCYMGMEPVADSGGVPYVFGVGRGEDGLWLRDDWASPGDPWDPRNSFLFRLCTSAA